MAAAVQIVSGQPYRISSDKEDIESTGFVGPFFHDVACVSGDITATLARPAHFVHLAAQGFIIQMRLGPTGSAAFLQGNSECPQDK